MNMSAKFSAIYGFSMNQWDIWLIRQSLRVLSIERPDGLALCWGVRPPEDAKAAVIVPRNDNFLERPEILKIYTSHRTDIPDFCIKSSPIPLVKLEVDVFNWYGWLVSRAEEYNRSVNDMHDRFPRRESLTHKMQIAEDPVADLLIAHLRDAIESVAAAADLPVRRISPWPDGKRFAVCLTHDVDHAISHSAGLAARKVAGAALSLARGNLTRARRRISEVSGLLPGSKLSPYWLFPIMADIERQRNIRSAFYLLPHLHRHVREGKNAAHRYDISDKHIKETFRDLAKQGWEIGLHTTYDAHEMANGIENDQQRLKDVLGNDIPLHGGRSHYLRFRTPHTWKSEIAAGMKYDATLGWENGWGFRSGTCWPYKPFDLETGSELPIWELGMHLMDGALGGKEEIIPAVKSLLDKVANVGGCACLLFHCSPPFDIITKEYLDLYEDVIDILTCRDDCWNAKPCEIIEAVHKADNLTL